MCNVITGYTPPRHHYIIKIPREQTPIRYVVRLGIYMIQASTFSRVRMVNVRAEANLADAIIEAASAGQILFRQTITPADPPAWDA